MNYLSTTINAACISLLLLVGVAVHDTKLDSFATALIGVPVVMSITESAGSMFRGDEHTHAERIVLSEMKSQNQPKLAPRYLEQKKHVMHRSTRGGAHRFDGCYMPA